jgi:GNAT superfamily N-acetyltransferase
VEIRARRAVRRDLPRMAELLRSGLDEIKELRGGPALAEGFGDSEGLRGALASALSDASRHAVLGTLDDEPVAVAIARADAARGAGAVEALYVEPGARGVGVGEAVLDEVLGWLRARRCSRVDATALPGDRPAKSFFEGSAFKARLIVYSREL